MNFLYKESMRTGTNKGSESGRLRSRAEREREREKEWKGARDIRRRERELSDDDCVITSFCLKRSPRSCMPWALSCQSRMRDSCDHFEVLFTTM